MTMMQEPSAMAENDASSGAVSHRVDLVRQRLLRRLNWSAIAIVACVFPLSVWLVPAGAATSIAVQVTALVCAAGIAAEVLRRRRHFLSAAWTQVSTHVLVAVILVLALGSVTRPYSALFPVTVAVSRMLLGRRASILVAVGCVAFLVPVAWFEHMGALAHEPIPASPLPSVVAWIALSALIWMTTSASIDAFEAALERERQVVERLQGEVRATALVASLARTAIHASDTREFGRGMMRRLREAFDASGVFVLRPHGAQVDLFGLSGERPSDAVEGGAALLELLDSLSDEAEVRPLGAVLGATGDEHGVVAKVSDGREKAGVLVMRGANDPERARPVVTAAAAVLSAALERDRQRAELALGQKLDAAGQLAGSVAHRLNNVLAALSGSAEALGDPSVPASELRDEIMAQVEAGRLITRHMLAVSRSTVRHPEQLDMQEVLTREAEGMRILWPSSIHVRVNADRNLYLLFDRAEFEEILACLTLNARDAMPAGGVLTLRARRGRLDDRPACEIEVHDTGAGMSEATLARAVEPFYTERVGHAGLGLSTVQAAVARVGGALHLESQQGEQSFTRVRILLPFDLDPRDSLAGAEPVAPGGYVLLVDDEAMVRRSLSRMLNRAGFEVIEAEDGQEALRVLSERTDVRLVLTDLLMPLVGGEVVAEAARERGLKVIVMSGFPDDEEKFAGHYEFLLKPFRMGDMVGLVRRMVDDGG